MSDVGVLGIDYDEFTQDSYKAATAYISSENKKRFESGNVEQDCVDAWNWMVEQGCFHIMFSSSFDHFLMDGDQWQFSEDHIIVRNKEAK